VVVSLAGLLVLALTFPVVGHYVYRTSPGGLWHRARRVGRDGRPFTLYKWRTMVVGADRDGPAVTSAGDPRVTPVGRRLRQTKLDELPQFWNVLKGDMSLVGPRPEDPTYVARYTPAQRRVLEVKPGITSPASVRYRHEEELLRGEGWEQVYLEEVLPAKLALELDYLARRSLLGDLWILVQTAGALLPARR
jgi:lipopolysaccharide/colanic/teichoic acid biosynthesis glycosyltransferase